jgi:hypothetical protein
MGSSIDDFLKEECIFEDAQAHAIKEVLAWRAAPKASRDDPSAVAAPSAEP